MQFSISTPPALGSATIDASTGAYAYTVSGFTTASSDTFKVTVSNGFASSTGTITVALNGDPLLPNQWHIQNTGQNAFASNLGLSGQDMNVVGAWASGYSGKGIKVGVVDSGLEAAHEDLAANVDLAHSYNFITGGNDPTPAAGSIGFDHGTAVAGIIGAVAFNGKGGRGVAYNASLRGYNLIASFSVANMATAMGNAPPSADNDLFNASFGFVGNAIPTFSSAFQNITATTMNMRGGLGAAIVNAAGNDFQDFESETSPLCQVSRLYGVSCGDPATDERRGGYAPIIVGALNAAGVHASYSSTGSALWISAPGGEYGLNSSYYTGASSYDPAIITTTRDGCVNALYPPTSYPNGVNPLDANGLNPLSSNCQYTAVMNGTSSATPNTAGTVAMMLEANPKLSVRDIKYILARTAKHLDAAFAGVSSNTIVPGRTIVLEQGWVTNGAGYSFSNRYGFGGVDAAAAVAMAKTYTSYLSAVQNSIGNYQFYAAAPATIPAQSAAGGYINFTVSEAFPTVEFVVVFLNIDSTPGLLCNQVELTSPSGTKSILLHAANGFTNAQIVNSRFESNAFYGEPINGTWTLRFLDLCAPSGIATVLATTQPQTLLFAGH
jgi:subtilisin family serine protease